MTSKISPLSPRKIKKVIPIDGINVWYASKAAAKLKLKVVFSGLGSDEVFFGYNHFKNIPLTYKYFAI